jgi:short-subunit dehydrogenase
LEAGVESAEDALAGEVIAAAQNGHGGLSQRGAVPMDVNAKVILVTGASSGIGRELARTLRRRGARLALLARNAKALEDLAAELAGTAPSPKGVPEVLSVPADVTDRAAVEHSVSTVLSRFGRIDVLVNCAGLGYFGPIETMPMEDLDKVIRTNVHGLLHVTQAALPALKESRGIIVNISSGLSMRALPFLSAYAGTKSMVNAVSDGMRLELAPYGIRVLTFCPPITATDFDRKALKGPGMEKVSFAGLKAAAIGKVAAHIAAAIRAEKREAGGGFLKLMNAIAPKLLDRIFAGMALRIGRQGGMYAGT